MVPLGESLLLAWWVLCHPGSGGGIAQERAGSTETSQRRSGRCFQGFPPCCRRRVSSACVGARQRPHAAQTFLRTVALSKGTGPSAGSLIRLPTDSLGEIFTGACLAVFGVGCDSKHAINGPPINVVKAAAANFLLGEKCFLPTPGCWADGPGAESCRGGV